MSSPDSISPPVSEVHPYPFPPPKEALAEDPAWNLLDVVSIAVFAILSLSISLFLAANIAHLIPRFQRFSRLELAQNLFVGVFAETFAWLMLVAFMVQLVHSKRRGSFFATISWNEPHWERLRSALAGGVGLAFLSIIFEGLFSHWIPKSLPIEKMFRTPGSAYVLAAFGVIMAPFVEELFFRGFLYPALARSVQGLFGRLTRLKAFHTMQDPALARRVGEGASVVLTAAGFAVVHQDQLAWAWVPLAWLFIVGVVLTVIRAKTKSVATCILVHLSYNITLFVFLFVSTQGFHHMDSQ